MTGGVSAFFIKHLVKSAYQPVEMIVFLHNIAHSFLLPGMTKEIMYTRRKRMRRHLEIPDQAELGEWLSANIRPSH